MYRPALNLLSYQVARTSSDPAAAAAAIVSEIHALDPTIPIFDVRTMTDRMSDSMAGSASRPSCSERSRCSR